VRRVSRVLGVVFALLRERPARVDDDEEGRQSVCAQKFHKRHVVFARVPTSERRGRSDERRATRAYHCNSAFQFMDDAGVSDASREDMAGNDATRMHVARRGRDADDDRDTDDDDDDDDDARASRRRARAGTRALRARRDRDRARRTPTTTTVVIPRRRRQSTDAIRSRANRSRPRDSSRPSSPGS